MPKQSRPLCYLDDEYEHRSVNVKDAKAKARSSDHSDKATVPAVVNKKRRLGRACTFCQRSHLVCEEERPCQRCVRRGIADECVRDDEDYAARRASKSKKSTSSSRMADPATERRTAPDPVAHDAMPWDEALFSSFFYDQDLSRALLDTTAPSLLTAPLTIDRACEAMFAGTLAAQQSPLQPPPPTNTNGNGKRSTPLRQRVKWFEPLPFRKGYASILRHLQDQRWQDANIASVQQALASVCALWYRREDVMQLSDLIQVQAQWATNLTTYRDHVLPHSPIAMLACRKAGEIYGANEPALKLLKRPATDFEDGVLSVYQMMTEQSAAQFFRLYERAIREKTAEVDEPASSNGKDQGSTVTLYWNADLIVESHEIDDPVTIHTRGVFHIKFSNLELPCLLILSFVPL